MRNAVLEDFMTRFAAFFLFAGAAFANGTVTDDIRISSAVLGYDLQYRVYLPEGYDSRADLPVLYLTDGQNYLGRGYMQRVLDNTISQGDIEPIVAVFVDARDPDNLKDNRRNSQFFCNKDYLTFYVNELIPEIEKKYPVAASREDRAIMGLSFGGLNAACFGLLGNGTFSKLGMQSPANHAVPNLLKAYEEMPKLPLKIFLSTGKPDDNTKANRRFHTILQDKGYELKYIEVSEGHNWDNWRPLLDDLLTYFYAKTD
jgi:enterochelin esterase-like enzyme